MFEDSDTFTTLGGIIWLILTMLIFVSILGGKDKFTRIVVYIVLWIGTVIVFDLWDEIPFLKD